MVYREHFSLPALLPASLVASTQHRNLTDGEGTSLLLEHYISSLGFEHIQQLNLLLSVRIGSHIWSLSIHSQLIPLSEKCRENRPEKHLSRVWWGQRKRTTCSCVQTNIQIYGMHWPGNPAIKAQWKACQKKFCKHLLLLGEFFKIPSY